MTDIYNTIGQLSFI